MIRFHSLIYCDALDLLFSDKADIKNLVKEEMCMSDLEIEQILYASEMEENMTEKFQNCPINTIMCYVTPDENNVTFSYAESEECHDLRCVAFNVPCDFNYSEWKLQMQNE